MYVCARTCWADADGVAGGVCGDITLHVFQRLGVEQRLLQHAVCSCWYFDGLSHARHQRLCVYMCVMLRHHLARVQLLLRPHAVEPLDVVHLPMHA